MFDLSLYRLLEHGHVLQKGLTDLVSDLEHGHVLQKGLADLVSDLEHGHVLQKGLTDLVSDLEQPTGGVGPSVRSPESKERAERQAGDLLER
jgi:hypothetical protein